MPKFQRRHYEAIAEVLREVRESQQIPAFELASVHLVAAKCAEVFARDNPRFVRAKFLIAVGGVTD